MKFPARNVFGRLPIRPVDLILSLNARWPRGKGRYYPKTQELFEFLEKIGKSKSKAIDSKRVTARGAQNFSAFYLDKNRKIHAFLLDYLWWSNKGSLLAAESEFVEGIVGMKHDFEKLLCWKAPLKLMIVREHPRILAETIRQVLSEYARSVPQLVKGECFVLFVFGKAANNAYLYVAPKDGASKFNFEAMPVQYAAPRGKGLRSVRYLPSRDRKRVHGVHKNNAQAGRGFQNRQP